MHDVVAENKMSGQRIEPLSTSKLPAKWILVLCGFGLLIVVVGNVLSVRSSNLPNQFSIGDFVRSLGLLVMLSGLLPYVAAPIVRRARKRKMAREAKVFPRLPDQGHAHRKERQNRRRIVFCYVGMLLAGPYAAFAFWAMLSQMFATFHIWRILMALVFYFPLVALPLSLAILFWIQIGILKRLRVLESTNESGREENDALLRGDDASHSRI